MTQGELAERLGITNQSVSKWETGESCPDVLLLPELAEIFGVSLDRLFGRSSGSSAADCCGSLRELFQSLPREQVYPAAYELAALLHEAVVTEDYREYVPWEVRDRWGDGSYEKWGFSAHNGPTGSSVMTAGDMMLYSSACLQQQPAEKGLSVTLGRLMRYGEDLPLLFSLFRVIQGDGSRWVDARELAADCGWSPERMEMVLREERLPLLTRHGEEGWSCALGSFAPMVPLLMMLNRYGADQPMQAAK